MLEKNKAEMNEEVIFQLISFSGDAKSSIFEAFESVTHGNYEAAEESLKNASETIVKAHNLQTGLIQKEAQGIHTELTLLMVHAQDQLMTTLLLQEIIRNMIGMQKEINTLKAKEA